MFACADLRPLPEQSRPRSGRKPSAWGLGRTIVNFRILVGVLFLPFFATTMPLGLCPNPCQCGAREPWSLCRQPFPRATYSSTLQMGCCRAVLPGSSRNDENAWVVALSPSPRSPSPRSVAPRRPSFERDTTFAASERPDRPPATGRLRPFRPFPAEAVRDVDRKLSSRAVSPSLVVIRRVPTLECLRGTPSSRLSAPTISIVRSQIVLETNPGSKSGPTASPAPSPVSSASPRCDRHVVRPRTAIPSTPPIVGELPSPHPLPSLGRLYDRPGDIHMGAMRACCLSTAPDTGPGDSTATRRGPWRTGNANGAFP